MYVLLLLALCLLALTLTAESGYSSQLMRAALNGDPDAQYQLGWCYYHGEGVLRDLREAVRWYSLAADQGHVDAQCDLGWCYFKGEGVPEDEVEAARWWRISARRGNPYAQFNLGWCHDNGFGVLQSKTEACKWYRESAAKGNANAQCNLGYCYFLGEGVNQDLAQAVRSRPRARPGTRRSAGGSWPRSRAIPTPCTIWGFATTTASELNRISAKLPAGTGWRLKAAPRPRFPIPAAA